jgi:hypothetical protein
LQSCSAPTIPHPGICSLWFPLLNFKITFVSLRPQSFKCSQVEFPFHSSTLVIVIHIGSSSFHLIGSSLPYSFGHLFSFPFCVCFLFHALCFIFCHSTITIAIARTWRIYSNKLATQGYGATLDPNSTTAPIHYQNGLSSSLATPPFPVRMSSTCHLPWPLLIWGPISAAFVVHTSISEGHRIEGATGRSTDCDEVNIQTTKLCILNRVHNLRGFLPAARTRSWPPFRRSTFCLLRPSPASSSPLQIPFVITEIDVHACEPIIVVVNSSQFTEPQDRNMVSRSAFELH